MAILLQFYVKPNEISSYNVIAGIVHVKFILRISNTCLK